MALNIYVANRVARFNSRCQSYKYIAKFYKIGYYTLRECMEARAMFVRNKRKKLK